MMMMMMINHSRLLRTALPQSQTIHYCHRRSTDFLMMMMMVIHDVDTDAGLLRLDAVGP